MSDARRHQEAPEHRFRPDIEGLRAVAILAVLLCHAGIPVFAGGYVGVDVFFVISGFLITRLLLAELSGTGRISLPRFYARRIKRLLPLSALLLATVAVLTFAILSPLRAIEVSKDIVSAAFYTANWHFAAKSVDYFAQGVEPSPVQHLWSLAIEEQFYLVWPTLMIGIAFLAKTFRASLRPVLWVTLITIFVASFVFGLGFLAEEPAAAYFSTFGRVWELALGAGLALLGALPLRRSVAAAIGWAGVAAILYALFFYSEETPFPGAAALAPTLGAAALILAGGAMYERTRPEPVPAWAPAAMLSTPPARYVGSISYAWYLWHWPALIFAAALWGPLSVAGGIAVVAASWVPTAISHYLVEEPFRRSKKLVQMPGRAIALGVACTAVALVSANLLTDAQPTLRTADKANVKGAAAMIDGEPLQITAKALLPNPLRARADKPKMFYDGCMLGIKGTVPHKCAYGDREGKRAVILFGDSHAMQHFPALEKVADENHWRLDTLIKAECSPGEVEVQSMIADREYSQCDVWREATLQRIEEFAPGTTVVLSGDTEYTPYGPDGEKLEGAEAAEALEAGYEATLKRLQAADIRVVVIRDTPSSVDDVPSCVSGELDHLDRCAFEREVDPNREFDLRAALAVPGTTLIDLTPEICPDELCRAVIGNALTYRDKDHLTATFARSLSPWFAKGLAEAGLH